MSSLDDHEISSVEPSEMETEEGRRFDDQVEKVLCDYAEKLTAIEQKHLSAIDQVERRAQNAQALAIVRGTRVAISSDVETKKRTELRKIEQQAARERTLLFIELKSELLEH